jgi:hypothetical protein
VLGLAAASVPRSAAAGSDAPASPVPVASPADTPRIVIEPTSFDFGSVRPDKAVEKEFLLRNHGRASLVIDSIATSCGCTAALTDTKVVKPGGSTPLRVKLVAPEEPGRLQKSILVKSNDPAHPALEVTITAVVTGPAPKTH